MSVIMGVCGPEEAAISTNILIVAVSITSRENKERRIVFEFNKPNQPITIRTTIGINIIFSGVKSIHSESLNHTNSRPIHVKHFGTNVNRRQAEDSSKIFLKNLL